LAQEGYPEAADAVLKLWIVRPGDPPAVLPAGPWIVVSEARLEPESHQRWLAVLDEESSLLDPWSPGTLRPALRALANPLAPSLLDSQALARLYAQGGRALADQMIRLFLQQAPILLQHAESDWHSDLRDLAQQRLQRLGELAGGVGATDLEDLVSVDPPDWAGLRRELQAARRVLEEQHRQERTV
jgi:hypothetical protein